MVRRSAIDTREHPSSRTFQGRSRTHHRHSSRNVDPSRLRRADPLPLRSLSQAGRSTVPVKADILVGSGSCEISRTRNFFACQENFRDTTFSRRARSEAGFTVAASKMSPVRNCLGIQSRFRHYLADFICVQKNSTMESDNECVRR
jgi:hypothetical protein